MTNAHIIRMGNESTCEVYVPGPVFTIRDTLYVGTLNGTGDDSQAYFLRLNFSKCYYGHVLVHYLSGYTDQRRDNTRIIILGFVQCLAPTISPHLHYSPMRSQHKHLDVVSTWCDQGYTIVPAVNQMTCTRAYNEGGTVTGVWKPPELICLVVY